MPTPRPSRAGQRKRFFNWQSTGDGGKTFVTLPSTPKSKTTVANLPPLTTYGFRVCVTNSDGVMGEWSQIVSFLVHAEHEPPGSCLIRPRQRPPELTARSAGGGRCRGSLRQSPRAGVVTSNRCD